jgi:Ca2+-binding RTX toxin-like protein
VTINGGGGANTVTVGSALLGGASTLDDIDSAVTFNGQSTGTDSLFINDQGPGAARTYTVRDDLVRRAGEPAINYSGVDSLYLLAGDGSDTVNVLGTHEDTWTTVYMGLGSDTANVGGSGSGNLANVEGRLIVYGDAYGPAAAPATDIDAVNFNDRNAAAWAGNIGWVYSFNWNTLERSDLFGAVTGEMSYYEVDTVTLNASNYDDEIELLGTPAGVAHTVNAGDGDDTFVVGNAGSLLWLDGDVTAHGEGGSDMLDYSMFGNRVRVNFALATQLATGLAGLSGIENASGGNEDDIFVGDANNNLFYGNGGHDLVIGGLGSDTVDGGTGDDLLIGGTTVYDTNMADLRAIRDFWSDTSLYFSERVNLLKNVGVGPQGSIRLDATTVQYDDGAVDFMPGGLDDDWFWADLTEDTGIALTETVN